MQIRLRGAGLALLGAMLSLCFVLAANSVTSVPTALAYPSCGWTSGDHYRTKATSASGDWRDIGTGVQTNSWANWHVDTDNGNKGFSNDAAWLWDNNDYSSIEAGFYTGYGYTWPFNDGMLPYYTTSNGEFADRAAGDFIPASSSTWMAGTTTYGNNDARAYVYNHYFGLSTYHVNTPRTNQANSEVDASGGSWMSGGAGENFDGYWQDTSYNFSAWGFNNNCADGQPGYWISNSGKFAWSSGGYSAW